MPAQTGIAIQRRWWPVQRATTDANGNATIEWPNVEPGHVWIVDMIVITAAGSLNGVCSLYFDLATQQGFITKSTNAIADTFEGVLEVPGGSQLLAVYNGFNAGELCTARLHYTEFASVNVPVDPTLANFRGAR